MTSSTFKEIVDFIRSLYPGRDTIPLHEPVFIGNEKKYLNDCIDSTFVSSVGRYVDLFEKKIAEYTGAKYAIATVNGTSALHIALMLAGVKPGDEVITQPLTFVATANAIKYCGADPVFIDVDMDTMGLSSEKLEHFLKHNTKVKRINSCLPAGKASTLQLFNSSTSRPISACIPMHTFGHPCRINDIVEICNKYNLPVIEDAAESLGSFYKQKHTGTLGQSGILSFNGNKIITTGGGGMIITNDERLAKRAKHLTTQAKLDYKLESDHDEVGYNYRLTNIQAALGVAQMESLPRILEKKREIALHYDSFFSGTAIEFIREPGNSRSNYWLNTISFSNKKERNGFLEFSNSAGIMTRPVWKLMSELDIYKNCYFSNINNAEQIANQLVNLPSSPN